MSRSLLDCHEYFQPNFKQDPHLFLIVLNSDFTNDLFKYLWKITGKKIFADGSCNRLYESQFRDSCIPSFIIGDFDSARSDVLDYYRKLGTNVIHDEGQDNNDIDKCFEYIYSKYTENSQNIRIIVLGDLSGRMDHAFGVLNSIYMHQDHFRDVILLNTKTYLKIYHKGDYKININKNIEGHFAGVVPFNEPIENITMKGFKWDLENFRMQYGSLISTSNEIIQDQVVIQSTNNFIFICSIELSKLSSLM